MFSSRVQLTCIAHMHPASLQGACICIACWWHWFGRTRTDGQRQWRDRCTSVTFMRGGGGVHEASWRLAVSRTCAAMTPEDTSAWSRTRCQITHIYLLIRLINLSAERQHLRGASHLSERVAHVSRRPRLPPPPPPPLTHATDQSSICLSQPQSADEVLTRLSAVTDNTIMKRKGSRRTRKHRSPRLSSSQLAWLLAGIHGAGIDRDTQSGVGGGGGRIQ